ncbi:MAG: LarC family nickel insertion protein, partial [Bacteroidales bacterium]|nr:LarC family nickel insertion protein [Bacteroidales bacterium]
LENTSTIGIRQYQVSKTMLPRTMETLNTPWGDVRIKKCSWNNQFKIKPEIDDCYRIASENNLSLQEVVFKVNVLISKKYYE